MRTTEPVAHAADRTQNSARHGKHQTKYVQNFYARSVVFHIGGVGTSMMQLIVTVLVFYVIIRAIDGFSLMLGGGDEADKRRGDKDHKPRPL